MKLSLDEALKRGVQAHRSGRFQDALSIYNAILEANPGHSDANHNLGVLQVSNGNPREALPHFQAALQSNPSVAQYWVSYADSLIRAGNLAEAAKVLDDAAQHQIETELLDQLRKKLSERSRTETQKSKLAQIFDYYSRGQIDEALALCNKMLADQPESAVLFTIQGTILAEMNRLDSAVAAYKKAIAIDSSIAEAHNNLGIALKKSGNLSAAISCFQEAIKLRPELHDAHNNLGSTLREHGELDSAILAFRQAIELHSEFPEAHNNLGNALMEKGDRGMAVDCFVKSLRLNPNYSQAYCNLGLAIHNLEFFTHNDQLQQVLAELLRHGNLVRPNDISKAVVSLLKCDPRIKEALTESNLQIEIERPREIINDIVAIPLFMQLMKVCPIPDEQLEALLTGLRKWILQKIGDLADEREVLEVLGALSHQCYINEYIYIESDEERMALQELESVIVQTLESGRQPDLAKVLCLSSYRALKDYAWSSQLNLGAGFAEIGQLQIAEPLEEKQLQKEIPKLDEIDNGVSVLVRQQYEENPYPRWIKTALRMFPTSIAGLVKEYRLRLSDIRIAEVHRPEILIAGCGTGQHSISTASKFANCRVLAVDLSLASLGYAKRKTREIGLDNVEYIQADILRLNKLGRKFDIVESAGVLHHMEDPMAGWKVLVECLKPGGLMRIALYSRYARQVVSEIREQSLSEFELGSEPLKNYRSKMLTSDRPQHRLARTSEDFYSLSAFRDLLFHVQEHQFTLPEIQKCLSELGLEFCGFEIADSQGNFKLASNQLDDPYDLGKWDQLEKADPGTFAGMYQFWCQRIH